MFETKLVKFFKELEKLGLKEEDERIYISKFFVKDNYQIEIVFEGRLKDSKVIINDVLVYDYGKTLTDNEKENIEKIFKQIFN